LGKREKDFVKKKGGEAGRKEIPRESLRIPSSRKKRALRQKEFGRPVRNAEGEKANETGRPNWYFYLHERAVLDDWFQKRKVKAAGKRRTLQRDYSRFWGEKDLCL